MINDLIEKRNSIIPIVKIDTDKSILKPFVFEPRKDIKEDGEIFKFVDKGSPNIVNCRYMISNHGRLWDTEKERFVPTSYNKPYNEDGSNDGYLKTKVKCYESEDKLYDRDRYMHRLVLEAFDKEHPGNVEVNHKDGVKTNNNLDNLEWVTKAENIDHALRTGLMRSCENSSSASLTNEQAEEICKMLESGMRIIDIAETTGATVNVVKHLKEKKNYRLISEKYNFPDTEYTLKDSDVEEICERIINGDTVTNIANDYSLSRAMIYKIINHKSYTHISSKYDFSNYDNSRYTSDEKVHEICKLLQDGKSTKEIINITGVTRTVIQKIRNRKQYTDISSQYTFEAARPMQNKLLEEDIIKVCELLQSGESMSNISSITGVKYQIVQNIQRRISYRSISDNYNW